MAVNSRNKETLHKDFFPWFFKDWMISGARARLSEPARSIYHDLLGLCYTEGGIVNDKVQLMLRLGTLPKYAREMDAAIAEFEVDPSDSSRLIHPRVLLEGERLDAKKIRASKGGIARKAHVTKPAQPSNGQSNDDSDEDDL